ncbi:hypothetical protein Syun_026228 [Stephania yunnanensis]|uniref:histone acetyltransferase n=1 Tax=Stephania yunnanensis TaxID=152371 RepID=A0AAP0EYM1_9MAGN
MVLKQAQQDLSSEPKKRRKVGFAAIDAGVEANDCISIFLVRTAEEVGSESSFHVDPIDLNQFFGDIGRIYGYKDLKVNVWFSSISFRAYADITYQSTSDGGKGVTELMPALQKIFGESLLEKRDDFLQSFSTDFHYIRNIISNGEVLYPDASKGSNGVSNHQMDGEVAPIEIVRMGLNSLPVGELYSRLVPLALLLVDGSSPIDVTDPKWEIYLEVEKKTTQQGDTNVRLLGFAVVYRFYRYPDNSRLRISQILILPNCQGNGHGWRLLKVINSVAISENVYDLTVEEPSDYLQHVRTCIDIPRLLAFEPVKPAVSSVASQLKERKLSKRTSGIQFDPPTAVVNAVRETLKITKKQFLQCWEVLIYLDIDQNDRNCMENYRILVAERMKADILGKDEGKSGKQVIEIPNDYDHDMTFVMFSPSKSKDQVDENENQMERNQGNQEEQLSKLVDVRMEQIKQIAEKVALHS